MDSALPSPSPITPLLLPLDALNRWAPVVWLRTDDYAFPLLQTLHLIGIGLLFGTICAVDLGLLGRLRQLDPRTLAASLLPWTWAGFGLALATGGLMAMTMAAELLTNTAFQLKMGTLLMAGCNAALLHTRGPLDGSSSITRWQARASLVLWIAAITFGRWIAYA